MKERLVIFAVGFCLTVVILKFFGVFVTAAIVGGAAALSHK